MARDGEAARSRRLLVLAPPALGAYLAAAWADRRSGTWPAVELESIPLPAADGSTRDPYRLVTRLPELVAGERPDAVLVVAPRRRGPARAVPGCIVGSGSGAGTVVGLVQADRPGHLDAWLDVTAGPGTASSATTRRSVVVAAMGKPGFTAIADGWLEQLRVGGIARRDLRADHTRRQALCAALTQGPPVVLYAGHGRARGWSGYQTVRWHHVEEVARGEPIGLVVTLACATLSRTRGVVPFGSRMVASGRARAYLGAVGPVLVTDARRLIDAMVAELCSGRHHDLAQVLRAVARDTDPRVQAVLRSYRLIGDPLTPVALPGVAPPGASRHERTAPGGHLPAAEPGDGRRMASLARASTP